MGVLASAALISLIVLFQAYSGNWEGTENGEVTVLAALVLSLGLFLANFLVCLPAFLILDLTLKSARVQGRLSYLLMGAAAWGLVAAFGGLLLDGEGGLDFAATGYTSLILFCILAAFAGGIAGSIFWEMVVKHRRLVMGW